MLLVLLTAGYASASDHPDSVAQPLADGCNRSQLLLLGEAGGALFHEGGPQVAPEWVYVNAGNTHTRAIRTLEGSVLGSYTAGQDLFGNHKSYDLNIDVKAAHGYEGLLSTRNQREAPPQIHTEWEPNLVPTWVWPSPGDRIRETGSWIWDCGHWQEGPRNVPSSDLAPGDPLGTAGAEHIGGEEAEIHPISELAVWRSPRAIVPSDSSRAVPASQLDAYISNQGGGAKSVIECALQPSNPTAAAQRAGENGGCSQLQDVTDRNYVYDLVAPRRRNPASRLRWSQAVLASHHAPRATIKVLSDRIRVTVPFKKVRASSELQDFGATYRVWWSKDTSPTHRFRVTLSKFTVYNNMDGDMGQSSSNPTITPNGEWNVYLDVSGRWRTLHKEVPGLRSIGHAPQTFRLSSLRPTEVDLTESGKFRMFVDARDCDLPGFTDCPAPAPGDSAARTPFELDFSARPGRAEVVLPVSRLVGTTTTFKIHPVVCTPKIHCTESNSDPKLCPHGCYDLSFTVQDVTRNGAAHDVRGDGTAAGSTYDGIATTGLPWWAPPATKVAIDQGEEAIFIKRVIELVRERMHDTGAATP